MGTSWIIAGLILLLQLATGLTLGQDQFRASGNTHIPTGRWPRLVKRSEEPEFFWMLIGCQTFLILVCLSARQMNRQEKKPQFDIQEILREHETQKSVKNREDGQNESEK